MPTRFVRQALLSVVVIAVLAIVLRVAAAAGPPAATVTTIVALGACATGLRMHRQDRGRTWRISWALLAVALALLTVSTTGAAFGGLPTVYPASIDWLGVVCALLAIVALGALLSSRAPGRAVDAALEGALIASACTYLPWAWAVT
ncbi:MAG TPA: hypothetical protein VGP92_07450, partial [Acidimicrobiia bacterium]|nr:hypothetical protein [Acidimicrobiia bacterium]